MKMFSWSPITNRVSDGDPNAVEDAPPTLDERAEVHPITLTVDDEYAEVAELRVPTRCGSVFQQSVINRRGVEYEVYVIRLPARALAEFGLRLAHDRISATLRGLLSRVRRADDASL